ncbi:MULTISPECIES: YheC/YheD family endospore coat-associated protein [unclassified Paenibacillus]|uniref:YheC/YheD family endospore coat-associated protein n=1 Tax=unclassified Paenibacillus TaxID=185978 RepID=UPI0036269FE0
MPSVRAYKRRPVIAILTVAKRNRLRGNLQYYRELIKEGHSRKATVFVTTVGNLNRSQKKIIGYDYNRRKKNGFIRTSFPFPDVIYNRIPERKDEKRPAAQREIRSCLRDRRVHLFNPFFFDKWTQYKWLSQSSKTKHFIPATKKLLTLDSLVSLFKRGPLVYIKPVSGKAGKGIMRVERKMIGATAQYRLIKQENGKRLIFKFTNVSSLWRKLKGKTGRRAYIAQQGITLARFKKRPFDLRLLVQKNNKGKWSISGIGARSAGKAGITTHVPRGGSIQDPKKLLNSNFGAAKANKIIGSSRKLALIVANQIERSSARTLGEMSMDIGVETNGRLWFFEANSKPMRFDEAGIRRRSVQRIIQYCLYLAKRKTSK